MSKIITQKAEENKQISERIKKTSKAFYEYNGKMMSVCNIYKSNIENVTFMAYNTQYH